MKNPAAGAFRALSIFNSRVWQTVSVPGGHLE
jgi:hypothetical protein